ncbi:hypothetical protein BJX68DRAFT_128795 [Aspergillus pseudodeflectus]|uniref:Disease resistance protein Aig2 n=1 Tax=Aspergillus pseudodeflectus TaxID=176178 RepID=A0ABR4K1Q0_9EURO
MGNHVLFFYGTLLAPEMLHRVIHGSPNPQQWQKDMLHFKPAILYRYRRHRVRREDYPAIIPVPSASSESTTATPGTATTDTTHSSTTNTSASVLGTVVSGLTDGDIYRLDVYEGLEYRRIRVSVRVLKEALPGSAFGTRDGNGNGDGNGRENTDRYLKDVLEAVPQNFTDEAEEIDAETYVWIGDSNRLQNEEWDFEEFKKEKMMWWLSASESDW